MYCTAIGELRSDSVSKYEIFIPYDLKQKQKECLTKIQMETYKSRENSVTLKWTIWVQQCCTCS